MQSHWVSFLEMIVGTLGIKRCTALVAVVLATGAGHVVAPLSFKETTGTLCALYSQRCRHLVF